MKKMSVGVRLKTSAVVRDDAPPPCVRDSNIIVFCAFIQYVPPPTKLLAIFLTPMHFLLFFVIRVNSSKNIRDTNRKHRNPHDDSIQ
jgi:hypothetical protein